MTKRKFSEIENDSGYLMINSHPTNSEKCVFSIENNLSRRLQFDYCYHIDNVYDFINYEFFCEYENINIVNLKK